MSFFVACLLMLIYITRSETILQSHSTDYTLTSSNSPYVVNSWVTFGSSANIIIENGVQIIFNDQYFISVFGSLNCGCSDYTSNKNTKGLLNSSTFIHILGNESMPTSTGIFINQQNSLNPPVIEFCNTLFDNIQNGIVSTSKQYAPYTVRHCEFRYINNAIHHSTDIINYVYNSYFHHVNNVKSGGGIIYDECLFHSFGTFSFDTQEATNIAIRNSEIYGDGVQICLNIYSIAGDPSIAIYNNIISDCMDAIEIWSAATIANNTITNCTRYGISAQFISGVIDIKYNVFEYNTASDIYLNDLFNAQITDNVFSAASSDKYEDYYANTTAVEAVACDTISIKENTFASLCYDHILALNRCDVVYIDANIFENNLNENSALLLDHIQNITISNNIWSGNKVQNGIISVQNGDNLYFTGNKVENNTIISTKCALCVYDMNIAQINANILSLNYAQTKTSLIYVQNTNHSAIASNIFIDNELYNIHSAYNQDIEITRNTFNGTAIESLHCIHIENTMNSYIGYNAFKDSKIYFQSMDATNNALIEYNDFIATKHTQYVSTHYIASYIHCNEGHIGSHSEYNIFAHFNNFYNTNYVDYIIFTIDININADSNYFDGLLVYSNIKDSIYDVCDEYGFVNISKVSEYSIDDAYTYSECRWNVINCGEITDYKCDSDTIASITSSLAPTTTHLAQTTDILLPTDILSLITQTSQAAAATTSTDILLPTIAITQTLEATTTTSLARASNAITDSLSPTTSAEVNAHDIYIEVTRNERRIDVDTTATEHILRDEQNTNHHTNNSIMIMLGSGGIAAIFVVFSAVLLYIFMKLKRLKQETVDLNKQIEENKRKSFGLNAIERVVFGRHKSESDASSKKRLKEIAAQAFEETAERHFPPRNYHLRDIPSAPKHDEDEKNDTDKFYERDNSSEMYGSYEIEGNETRDDDHIYALDDDHMIMNAINTAMTQNIGELSVQFSQSAQPHIKSESNFALKIDIAMINDEDSEEETTASSASFTVKTEEEHKIACDCDLNCDIEQHMNHIGLMSPTETTQAESPATPQLPLSPTRHPDQILHSLQLRNSHKSNTCDTPPGIQYVPKLPIPKTKGQWM